ASVRQTDADIRSREDSRPTRDVIGHPLNELPIGSIRFSANTDGDLAYLICDEAQDECSNKWLRSQRFLPAAACKRPVDETDGEVGQGRWRGHYVTILWIDLEKVGKQSDGGPACEEAVCF